MRFKECKLVDAMNGLEALEILSRENGFDLILLDINMPVMNGSSSWKAERNRNSPNIP